jgi:hypothetical protein
LCRCRDGDLNAGSRTGCRDTFFCLAKRKYPKKRPPRCRLFPALLGFERGCLKGLPSPCMQRAASLRRPYGLIRSKAPVLGAACGRKPTGNLKFNQLRSVGFCRRKEAHRSRSMRPLCAAPPRREAEPCHVRGSLLVMICFSSSMLSAGRLM